MPWPNMTVVEHWMTKAIVAKKRLRTDVQTRTHAANSHTHLTRNPTFEKPADENVPPAAKWLVDSLSRTLRAFSCLLQQQLCNNSKRCIEMQKKITSLQQYTRLSVERLPNFQLIATENRTPGWVKETRIPDSDVNLFRGNEPVRRSTPLTFLWDFCASTTGRSDIKQIAVALWARPPVLSHCHKKPHRLWR